MAKADGENCDSIMDTLQSFWEASGQLKSCQKPKIYVSPNIRRGEVTNLSLQSTSLLPIYDLDHY